MGDPAEENDPPPESRRFFTKRFQSVNRKTKKNVSIRKFPYTPVMNS